ncbi:TetR/AcrR family transcriptional regulator [Actinomadura sp. 9N407]|uniref:TetR/AcrR family transcriptional regulator n=1 Tax=Actinomadura sp. 9N407 TaxID=3375154 RepID=UPI003794B8DE
MPKISAGTLGEHRAQTVDRIFDAVARLSRDRGIDTISMTQVATAAEVTRTALYNYFPDKAALLLAFTERVTAYFIESFERGLPKNADATTRLRAFVRLQLRGLIAHPHPSAAEVTAALGPEAYEALAAHVAPMQRILAGILAEGVESGEFRRTDIDATARSILAVVGAERLPLIADATTIRKSERNVTAFVLAAVAASR